ncbi:hypothetical protein TNCV_2941061 [Trichonephila clavipes]|nr:hypothetical protein TNCV_2941061 [Trichonephila clavipes]
MSQRSHLTNSEAWRVVGRLEGAQTQAKVVQVIGVSQSVISRIWNRFLEIGRAGQRLGQGRRRATTPNEDRLFSDNGSETPKYERYSSPTIPSLGYWHHGFNSDCPKPAPWCRSISSPADGVFSSGWTVTVGIILRSSTKVSDLVVGESWCKVASPLTGAQISTSFEMDL